MRVQGWFAAIAVGLCAAACSQGTDQHASAPVEGAYQISFPSTLTAVLTDSVEVYVFDAGAPGADCLSLVATRQAQAALPVAPALLEDTGAIALCQLASTPLSLSFGRRSVLVIAQHGGTDLLSGCVQAVVEADSGMLTIYLARSNLTVPLPTTTCTSVGQKCAGGC
ncbi:MAG: hypothetical protein ACRELB_23340 [Polyangiaceae bacterium]